MLQQSLRVLVVEDDYFLARNLAEEIRDCGDQVIGPFADIGAAIANVARAEVAILDVRIRGHQSFPIADSLISREVPFVFLTGYDRDCFPQRFLDRHIYQKPSRTGLLLDDLHGQHAEGITARDDSIETAVIRLLQRARYLLPDTASAERLVEATLLRAIAETEAGAPGERISAFLLSLLEDEFRQRGRLYLN